MLSIIFYLFITYKLKLYFQKNKLINKIILLFWFRQKYFFILDMLRVNFIYCGKINRKINF